jgi:hypothetical protein
MSDDNKQLANHLFAVATAMLKDAIETAATGQSAHLTMVQLERHGSTLRAIAQDIATVADTATIVARVAADERWQ